MQDEDDVEIVPETQPINETRAAKRGKKKAASEPIRRVKWTDDEEVALTESFIAVSCDSIVGNAQSLEKLWSRISLHFHALLNREVYRTDDALSGKWTPLRAECTKFNGLYNNILNMNASGSTTQNFIEEATRQYKVKFKKAFTHLAAWRVMHSSQKWAWVTESGSQQSSGSKRPASDSIDINSEPIEIGENEPEVRLPRPIGRNKAKKLAQQQTRVEATAKHVAEIVADKLSGKLEDHLNFMKDFAKQKKEQHEEAQIEREMNALNVMPRHGLPEEDRAAMLRMKAKIHAKHTE